MNTNTQSQPHAAGEAAHTPTPWNLGDHPARGKHINGKDGWAVAQAFGDSHAEQAANAAFIVRAVNSHKALVEALEGFLEYDMRTGLYDALRLVPAGQDGMTEEQILYLDTVDKARAALELAKRATP